MAVDEATVPLRTFVLLLMFGVCLYIYGDSPTRPSQLFSPELVIPLKVTSRARGAKGMGLLSYSLRFGGQRHIIHLRVKKHLVSRHFQVFTYTDQRTLQQDRPFVPADCYYHGYVEGIPQSLVALSTCSGGFRGMLMINDLAYEIKPVRFSASFEHLLYKIDSDDTQLPPKRCGVTDDKIAQQRKFQESFNLTLRQTHFKSWWTHWRYIDLLVFVDHLRFLYQYNNVSLVEQEVFTVVNIVDSLYQSIRVDVSLTELEIWNVENPVPDWDIDNFLKYFSVWKLIAFGARTEHDISHVFIKKSFGITLGLAYVGTVCRFPYNSGIESFTSDDVAAFSITVAHEIGHNLGMQHDKIECVCEFAFCIMYPSLHATDKFSNCSYESYWNTALQFGTCLSTAAQRQIISIHFCGNLRVEEGEQCDCGTIYQCANDQCCRLNCTLKPGAVCGSGMCCENCRFLPSGTLCRQQVSECDLPEWCHGNSPECPEDTFVQNGLPCSNSSFCFLSRCSTTHDIQCKRLFGKDARTASHACFQEVNVQNNRFGHCGIVNNTFVRCADHNFLCGRLQCENVKTIPNMINHTTVHQFYLNGTTCWGTDYHLGMNIPDNGLVEDGTECGSQMFCLHQSCISLENACFPEICHNNGVCNSKENCHCHYGWAPPHCNVKGYGGSIDSGPPPIYLGRKKKRLDFLTILWIIPFIVFFLYVSLVHFRREKERNKRVENGGIMPNKSNGESNKESNEKENDGGEMPNSSRGEN
ncbi:disintegrin and metalloproteinase domain-containing protein 20-like [Sorex araneus]|uniref:disintegrin and metalloproteinase domain-containing protein 20-like n=1 Tax=Sorex araneus TaxID=42254 RepID=UPI00243360B5|nr:disintegrin and metalloproteinase domain-containing protein 20-like [Sorex araneus]